MGRRDECFVPEFVPPPADLSRDVGAGSVLFPTPTDPSWDVGGGVFANVIVEGVEFFF